MIKQLLGMALPPWVGPVAIVAGIAIFGGTCYIKGMAAVQEKWDTEAQVRKLTETIEYRRVETVIDRVMYQVVPQIRVVEKQGKDIVKKVHVYVPQEADNNCVINDGFVRLHEAARSGVQLPEDSAGTTDAASGVRLSDVGRVITINYTKFRKMKLQCQGLLDIVNSLPQETR